MLACVALLGLAFRVAIVRAYPSASPDSHQYYALAESLLRDGRLAFGPPPAQLTHTRPPGYPLFLALVDHRLMPERQHTLRVVTANAILDSLTALCLVALALQWGLGFAAGAIALVFEFIFPPAFLFAAYALTESLATVLGTGALALAFVAYRRPRMSLGFVIGLVIGYAMLVRIDMLVVLPAVGAVLWWAPSERRQRLRTLAALGGGLVLMLGPWALRNQLLFGAPYLPGTEWSNLAGRPLPTGVLKWERTWANGAPGSELFNIYLFFGARLPPRIVTPKMYDSESERRELLAIVNLINKQGPTGEADRRFVALAEARTRRRPLRTFVELPLQRMLQLFIPEPRGSFPLNIAWLGLPKYRPYFLHVSLLAYALALGGLLLLWRAGGQQRFAAKIALLLIGTRALLYSFAVPHDVGQRKLIEVVPVILLLASIPVARLFRLRPKAA